MTPGRGGELEHSEIVRVCGLVPRALHVNNADQHEAVCFMSGF